MTTPLRIDVWSDLACPWCYIGKRRLDAALAQAAPAGGVEVTWRAFELDPTAPAAVLTKKVVRTTFVSGNRSKLRKLGCHNGAATGASLFFVRDSILV
mgnify:CR=1 FL=1